MKRILHLIAIAAIACLFIHTANAQRQRPPLSRADTLRGSYGPGRDWWDVLKYDLHLGFNMADSTINGFNAISLKVLKTPDYIQIDLQDPMLIDSILLLTKMKGRQSSRTALAAAKYGNAYWIDIARVSLQVNTYHTLLVYYHGKPRIARRPPWDGGLIWKKDKNNNPWVTVACQGLGASVWYPCKDHQADEPDSAEMHITIPDSLACVGNGPSRGKINTATVQLPTTGPW